MPPSIPKYRRRSDGYAFVEHRSIATRSHRLTLGKYGSPESHRRYAAFIASLRDAASLPALVPGRWPKVDPLTGLYLDAAEKKYGGSSTYVCALHALDKLKPYADWCASDFGPRQLAEVQSQLIADQYARKTVNEYVSSIRRFWRWCCKQELCPPDLYHKLLSVDGLRTPRADCHEPAKIQPATFGMLNAVARFLHPQISVMAHVQYFCGMRPGEVCRMRAVDIDISGAIWLCRTPEHKNDWRGITQVKAVPSIAQALLEPYMGNRPYLFQTGNKRVHYTAETYRRAVSYGFKRAEKAGANLTKWVPNQLRHGVASWVEQQLGIEAAQLWLGHTEPDTTAIYIKRMERELIDRAVELDARWIASV